MNRDGSRTVRHAGLFGVLRILPPENAVEGCWCIEQIQVRRIRCRIRRTFFAENRKVLYANITKNEAVFLHGHFRKSLAQLLGILLY